MQHLQLGRWLLGLKLIHSGDGGLLLSMYFTFSLTEVALATITFLRAGDDDPPSDLGFWKQILICRKPSVVDSQRHGDQESHRVQNHEDLMANLIFFLAGQLLKPQWVKDARDEWHLPKQSRMLRLPLMAQTPCSSPANGWHNCTSQVSIYRLTRFSSWSI